MDRLCIKCLTYTKFDKIDNRKKVDASTMEESTIEWWQCTKCGQKIKLEFPTGEIDSRNVV